MPKQSQSEIDQMIQRARSTNRDLVRRDVISGVHSPISELILKLLEYYYNDGTSKELLCLAGVVGCQYKGNRYFIPVEIWLEQDHPNLPPLAYVKPTPDMYISPENKDVQPNGTIILSYLKNWRHPNSDLAHLLKAMSEAFSQAPPVYSHSVAQNQATTPYPNLGAQTQATTPYPTNAMSMPTPMPMGSVANTSYSYPHGYPQTQIPQNIVLDSLQTAVLDKVRNRLDEITQIGKAQIDSLKKTEQDLNEGEKKLQLLMNDVQQQQIQAQDYITNIRAKTSEMAEATEKMSSSSSGKENSIKDDALTTPAPVYKQLLQAYAEEHAIQDLLYYLGDGLRRKSIGLDTYLKHFRELSRKQFVLRATMHKCRQVASLPVK